MNQSELVTLVAQQTTVEPSIVAPILEQAFEIIALTLTVEEEVALRGFGKFRPGRLAATSLRNPKTGEPVSVGERRSVRFTPAARLKQRMNGAAPAPL